MVKGFRFWRPILMGVLATPIIFFLGAFLSGGGHTVMPFILFFPYGMLTGLIFSGAALAWFDRCRTPIPSLRAGPFLGKTGLLGKAKRQLCLTKGFGG